MKKEKKEIAVNVSSGAEKVENIEQEIKKKSGDGGKKIETKTVRKTEKPATQAKEEAALGFDEEKATGKAKEESARAKARVRAELKKQELKKKRQQAAAQRAKKRKEAAEKRAAQAEERRRERAHRKANRKQEQSRRKANREKRAQERRDSNKGYGGWIAAVVTLGVTTLALTSALTVESIDMERAKQGMYSSQRATMYELTGIMENVDEDLDRIRISNTVPQQERILTDLLVQARLAELDLEKMPIPAEADRCATTFINNIAGECERLLGKLRQGERLSEQDFATLEALYEKNHSVCAELGGMLANVREKDLESFLKDGKGKIGDGLRKIEGMTLEENKAVFGKKKPPKKDEFDKESSETESLPQSSDSGQMPMPLPAVDGDALSSTKAEELCAKYFKDYKIKDFHCVGETVNKGFTAYNVQGYDEKGTLLFAEIDNKNGKLLRFDYYENCKDETFDMQNAERIAEEFLDELGYDDMEVVRVRNNGTMADFTFVYEDDDVVYYPDEIRVKVCRTRGVVTAMDATKYLQNHRGRDALNVKLSRQEAQKKLHSKLEVESGRLALVKTVRGEVPAYEFLCSYQEDQYYVFVDANTGNEISIVNVKEIQ